MITRTLDRVGDCVCGEPMAFHFDRLNRRLTCDQAARIARLTGAVRTGSLPRPLGVSRVLPFSRTVDHAQALEDQLPTQQADGPSQDDPRTFDLGDQVAKRVLGPVIRMAGGEV